MFHLVSEQESIAFLRRKFNAAERNYGVGEQELQEHWLWSMP